MKIIAFDPGISNIGVAVIDYSKELLLIESIDTENLNPDTLNKKSAYRSMSELHGDRFAKIQSLTAQALEILIENKPDVICCEAPFYNIKRPAAYSALVEIIYALKLTTSSYKLTLPFFMIEPLLIKKIFVGTARADKDVMREAIVAKELPLSKPISEMTEHEIDAVAVGFSFLKINKIL